jgi:8-oxo-dGTP pyrophosphatase MutT (NUDIX family)
MIRPVLTPQIFGSPVGGVTYEKRIAAYAVIRNPAGAVAAVQTPAGYWLPGGGTRPGETPEETVVREVREEFGHALRLIGTIGEAV